MFGASEFGSNGGRRLAVLGDVEIGRAVGIVRVLQFLGEEKLPHPRRRTSPSHGSAGGGSGSGARQGRLRLGGIAAAMIEASARFGSFSPPCPVSTVRVTSKRGYSDGRPRHDEFHARARRHADVIAPDALRRAAIGAVHRHAVDGDDVRALRASPNSTARFR